MLLTVVAGLEKSVFFCGSILSQLIEFVLEKKTFNGMIAHWISMKYFLHFLGGNKTKGNKFPLLHGAGCLSLGRAECNAISYSRSLASIFICGNKIFSIENRKKCFAGKQRCVQGARWPGWFPHDFLQIKKYLNFLPRCDPCGSTIVVIEDNGPPCVKMVHSKYLLLNECLTWQKAVKRCNNFQSRLALPKNIQENEDFLADAKNLDFEYGFWIAVTETPE